MKLEIFDRFIDYSEIDELFENVKNKEQGIEEKIFVLEHNDVYTAGKSILNKKVEYIKGIPVFYAERGGLWTWHGKGQVVVYFIYNLKAHSITISDFMAIIENIVIKCINAELKKYNNRNNVDKFELFANQEKRGFWIKDIASGEILKFGFIGLKISNGFVNHGISINNNNDLQWFDFINPCGLGDVKITSIKDILMNYYKCENNIQLDINKFKYFIGSAMVNELQKNKKTN